MWDQVTIRATLERVAQNEQTVEQALSTLATLPFEDIEFAKIDHHRQLRRGYPEVVYCAGKTPQQTAQIMERLAAGVPRVLGTRATAEHFAEVAKLLPNAHFDATARVIWIDQYPDTPRKAGIVLLAAGTSDLPVAEEAAITLDMLGHRPRRIYDVGVAGIARLLHQLPILRSANVVIVVAGMEGALPGVVAGLIDAPVIAVPASVGYGASFGGLAALLGMLNSCSPGVAVVNIDNGFGAAYMAASINGKIATEATDE
jgi:NCAIR mutase (PurE)-related protein